jgi:DegV family protein with EDD domain
MIRIIVDSSADYNMAEINDKQMTLVSLNISLGEKNYLDGVDITRDELYEWLIESKDFPKTSQPSPEIFVKHFEEAKEANDDVICILLSSALSGTCQSAHLAKSMVDYDNIHIIDSLCATHLIRFLANKAVSPCQ